MNEAKKLKEQSQISGYASSIQKAQRYEELGLNLMKNQKAKTSLDPLTVLNLIPDDWDIITE